MEPQAVAFQVNLIRMPHVVTKRVNFLFFYSMLGNSRNS